MLEEKLNQDGQVGAATGGEVCQQPESVRPARLGPAQQGFRREARTGKGDHEIRSESNTKPANRRTRVVERSQF